jgi:hypothetical protein
MAFGVSIYPADAAQQATSLSGSATQIRSQWENILHNFQGLSPKTAAVQVALASGTNPLRQHTQDMQELQQMLNTASTHLRQFSGNLLFSHPTILDTIKNWTSTHSPGPDSTATVLSDLRTKYGLTDSDIR